MRPFTSLLLRVGDHVCAAPIEAVLEVMRPRPTVPVAGAPPGVLGVAVIREASVPVVSLATLFGTGETVAGRYVTVRAGDRTIALAVDSVDGVQTLTDAVQDVPPLLQSRFADAITGIGTHDGALLLVLGTFRLLPEGWMA